MVQPIIPAAWAAQTSSFSVMESKNADGCNYQHRAQEIKKLKWRNYRLHCQTAALSGTQSKDLSWRERACPRILKVRVRFWQEQSEDDFVFSTIKSDMFGPAPPSHLKSVTQCRWGHLTLKPCGTSRDDAADDAYQTAAPWCLSAICNLIKAAFTDSGGLNPSDLLFACTSISTETAEGTSNYLKTKIKHIGHLSIVTYRWRNPCAFAHMPPILKGVAQQSLQLRLIIAGCWGIEQSWEGTVLMGCGEALWWFFCSHCLLSIRIM